jgi:hypothetical protein
VGDVVFVVAYRINERFSSKKERLLFRGAARSACLMASEDLEEATLQPTSQPLELTLHEGYLEGEQETHPLLEAPSDEGVIEDQNPVMRGEEKEKEKEITLETREGALTQISSPIGRLKKSALRTPDSPRKKVRWVDEDDEGDDVEMAEIIENNEGEALEKGTRGRGRHHHSKKKKKKKKRGHRKLAEVRVVERYLSKKVKVPKWCRTCLRYKFRILIGFFVLLSVFLFSYFTFLQIFGKSK